MNERVRIPISSSLRKYRIIGWWHGAVNFSHALMQFSQVYWRYIKKTASDDGRKRHRQACRRIVRYFLNGSRSGPLPEGAVSEADWGSQRELAGRQARLREFIRGMLSCDINRHGNIKI